MRHLFTSSTAIIRNAMILIFVVSVVVIYSSSSGIVGRTQLNGDGCTCHGASSSSVNVTITGPDEIEVGQSAEYSVSISGGPANSAGTNIAASDGEIDPVSGTLRKQSGELTHISPVTFSGSSVEFVFSLKAPDTEGELILYANGNSVNGNGTTTGDEWNFASNKTVTITETTSLISVGGEGIPEEFALQQNYPNPFNPSTQIPFSVSKAGFVSLKVYDMLGKEVANLVNKPMQAGEYIVPFNAAELNSGTYIYALKAEGQTVTKKMLYIK